MLEPSSPDEQLFKVSAESYFPSRGTDFALEPLGAAEGHVSQLTCDGLDLRPGTGHLSLIFPLVS